MSKWHECDEGIWIDNVDEGFKKILFEAEKTGRTNLLEFRIRIVEEDPESPNDMLVWLNIRQRPSGYKL